MRILDLGLISYNDAWAEQRRLHDEITAGGEEAILTLEHPPVITMGRRGETLGVTNLRATPPELAERGVEFVQSDRGGDVTFHGPGQLVVYPIIRLAERKISVGRYVRLLQNVVIAALAKFDIVAETDDAGIGVWVRPAKHAAAPPEKICAFGVRVTRGATLHGLALNVTTDLSYFDLIVPCGIADRRVTSMKRILGDNCPPMTLIKSMIVESLLSEIRH